MAQLKRVDWVGSVLFVASTTSLMIPITWGGVMFAWNAWQTLVPLLLGAAGIISFALYERFVALEPLMRLSIFASWNAKITYFQTIVHGMVVSQLFLINYNHLITCLSFGPLSTIFLYIMRLCLDIAISSLVLPLFQNLSPSPLQVLLRVWQLPFLEGIDGVCGLAGQSRLSAVVLLSSLM